MNSSYVSHSKLAPREDLGAYYKKGFRYFKKNFPHFDETSTELLLNLIRTSDFLWNIIHKRMRSYGLTGPSFGVLMMLESSPLRKLPMNQMGRRLVVTAPNITGLVDTLEKAGWVHREAHPQDRRVTLVAMTPSGHRKLWGILPEHFRFVKKLFAGFTHQQKRVFMELLEKFRRDSLDTKEK